MSSAKADELVALLDLLPGARVLDAGCGKGGLLFRVVETYGADGVGIDRSPHFMEEARARAAERPAVGTVELLEMDIAEYAVEPASLDLSICVGSTQLYGDYRSALQVLSQLVRPGGLLLMGEGYWKGEPDPAYLQALEASRDDLTDHAGNVAIALEEGLTPLYSCVSNEDEWDRYEGLYLRGIERYVADHPEDPDAPAMLQRIRSWRDVYLRWGRDTLGFGLYLLCV